MQKKWPVMIFPDKTAGFLCFPVSQILTRAARFKRRNISRSIFIIIVRIKVGGRLPEIAAAEIIVKSLLLRIPVICSQVPFADMAGYISSRL